MSTKLLKNGVTKQIEQNGKQIVKSHREDFKDECFLYHLGINIEKINLPEIFGDVKHGMGFASFNIVLHEVMKLLQYADVKDPEFFRIGTCGGIGILEGTVLISEKIVNDFFEEQYEMNVLGKRIKLPAKWDQNLIKNLKNISATKNSDMKMLSGTTMSVEHFYESVASTEVSFCLNNDAERDEHIDLMKKHGILALDMEAIALAAITYHMGIKSASVFVNTNNICGAELPIN